MRNGSSRKKPAFIFSDSKIAISATTGSKSKTNVDLCRAVRAAHSMFALVINVEIHWIRGHSRIGGNERVDRISKRYARVVDNSSRVSFDTVLSAHISVSQWPFGSLLADFPYDSQFLHVKQPLRRLQTQTLLHLWLYAY